MKTFHGLTLVLACCGTGAFAPAQQADPIREIKEIARTVDEQLQEIDRLLLESSKKAQPRSEPKAKLKEAHEHSETVEDGINKLIEKLTEMKNQSGGGSSQSEGQQDQKPQDGQSQGQGQQPKGQGGNRRENQTPDFVKQEKEGGQPQSGEPQPGQPQPGKPEPQPGQQPKDQPNPDGSPNGGQQTPAGGQNTVGNRPPQSETGPGQRGDGEQSWGELQSYVNFLKNRGSAPKVPEKYRKYWEAYLKQKQQNGGK